MKVEKLDGDVACEEEAGAVMGVCLRGFLLDAVLFPAGEGGGFAFAEDGLGFEDVFFDVVIERSALGEGGEE